LKNPIRFLLSLLTLGAILKCYDINYEISQTRTYFDDAVEISYRCADCYDCRGNFFVTLKKPGTYAIGFIAGDVGVEENLPENFAVTLKEGDSAKELIVENRGFFNSTADCLVTVLKDTLNEDGYFRVCPTLTKKKK
jgi:hypothetical protein